MRTLSWGFVAVCVLAVAYFVYDSQRAVEVPLPQPKASSTPPEMQEIIPGVPSVLYRDPLYGFGLYYPATSALAAAGFEGSLVLAKTPVVAVALNPDLFQGTNLRDAGIYVGATTTAAIVAGCLEPAASAGETLATSSAEINGISFAQFDSSSAGAGNIYDTKSYRTVSHGACLEFDEVLHSMQLGNFPKNTVVAFDAAHYSGILDAMLQTIDFTSATTTAQ